MENAQTFQKIRCTKTKQNKYFLIYLIVLNPNSSIFLFIINYVVIDSAKKEKKVL